MPRGLVAHPNVGDDVDQQPLAVFAQVLCMNPYPTVSDTAIGRYWVIALSTCTAPMAGNGKSKPVISSITVGNVRVNG